MKKYFAVLGLVALLATGCEEEDKKSDPVVITSIVGTWRYQFSTTEYVEFIFRENGTISHTFINEGLSGTATGTYSIGATVGEGSELDIIWNNDATGDLAWLNPEDDHDYSLYKIENNRLIIAGSTGDESDFTILGFMVEANRPQNFDNEDQVWEFDWYAASSSSAPEVFSKRIKSFRKR